MQLGTSAGELPLIDSGGNLVSASLRHATKSAATCGAIITVGAVLAPGLGAGAAHAADVTYEFTTVRLFEGAYAQKLPVEANVSSTSIGAAGERVDFRFSVDYGRWEPGWLYPIDAFKLTVDLSQIADDVADIDAVFDELEFTPVQGLTMERTGNVVTFLGEFDKAHENFEVRFSAVLARGGDGSLSAAARVESRGTDEWNGERWDYGPHGDIGVSSIAANPAPLVSKSVDRTRVTEAAPEARYSIAVQRPAGGNLGPNQSFTLTDDLSDLLAESGGIEPRDIRVERGAVLGEPTIENGILTATGNYDEHGEFLLSFAASHLGLGDGVMRNTACAQSAPRTTTVQVDPNIPVSGNPGDGTSATASVPGETACATAPDVLIDGLVPDPDPGTETGPDSDPAQDQDPGLAVKPGAPAAPAAQLAATGTDPAAPLAPLALAAGLAVAGASALAVARRGKGGNEGSAARARA